MTEARCDEHIGEVFPRRCAACDSAASEVAAERAAEQPLSGPVAAHEGPGGPVTRRRRRSAALSPSVPSDAATAGEGSQNLAPEALWDRLG